MTPVRRLSLALLLVVLACSVTLCAQNRQQRPPAQPGPMLKDGTFDVDTPEFTLTLVKSSQTVAALKPKGANGFDFTPGDILVERSQDGYYHLGDIDLRLRTGSGEWKSYSSALARTPVTAMPTPAPGILAAADLTPTLPADIPLTVTRAWVIKNR